MHNNDKTALINSMNNLIKHIVSSREAQQQIFYSLERKDFEKIINNLADPVIYLRLISAQLIGQLLHQSQSLQQEFCKTMGVHFSNDSELIVSNNFDKIIQSYPHRVLEIFKLIKTHHQIRLCSFKKINNFLWFINPEKETLSIEYLSKEQIQELIKSYQSLQNPQQSHFDPMYCIFGVLTTASPTSQVYLKQNSTQNTQFSHNRDVTQMFGAQRPKPIYFQPYVLRNNKVSNNPAHNPPQQNLVAKLNTQNLTINYVVSPVKTERCLENQSQEEAGEKPIKKISLSDNRKRLNLSQEQNMAKFVYNESEKNNLINGCMSAKIKQKIRPEISKSSHLPCYTYNPVENTYVNSSMNSSANFKQELVNGGGCLLAPSLKVKNIAMNGRHGWETAKNNKTFDGIPF